MLQKTIKKYKKRSKQLLKRVVVKKIAKFFKTIFLYHHNVFHEKLYKAFLLSNISHCLSSYPPVLILPKIKFHQPIKLKEIEKYQNKQKPKQKKMRRWLDLDKKLAQISSPPK